MKDPMRATSTLGLSAAALLLAGPGALGQEPAPSPPPEDPQSLPRFHEVVEVEGELPTLPTANLTALKSPLPIQATPASVSVVPRAVFESQGGAVLGDALRNVSGVNVATGFGVFDFFVIRGFDSLSSGLVLTDGAFEPEVTFYPLYNLGRVEVLKGPAAFLYGANPLSGGVHLVRKQPRAGRFAELSLSYGRFDSLEGALDANLGRGDGSLSFRLNAFYQGSDGYRNDKASAFGGVNPALTWRPDGRTTLALNVEYVRSEFTPDSGLPLLEGALPQVPRTRSYQSPFDASDQDIHRLRLDLERRIGERVTLRNKLYLTRLDWRSDGTLLNGAFPNQQGRAEVSRSLVLLDDRQVILGDQIEALVSFSTGPLGHELLAGLEASRLTDDFTLDVALLPPVDLLAPVETARKPPLFLLPGLSTAGDARSLVVAGYFVDRITLSRKVHLVAGARLDLLDYDDEATGTSRNDLEPSPLCAVVYTPSRGLSFYANAAGAFAPPSTQVVGEREPEKSRQAEVGAKKSLLGGRGLATLALYYLKKDGIAISDATGVIRQTGDQRSQGIELELAAEVAKDWFASLGYAHTDAELTRFSERAVVGFDPATFSPIFGTLDRSGNAAAFAPRHMAHLWTFRHFPSGLGLGLGARYVSRQFIAEDNSFAIKGYLLLDAMASFKRGRWRWSLNLKNLTDREHETRGFGSTAVLPGRPFAAYAKVELTLGSR